jgi:multiple sugar transport system permease protein
VQAGGASVNGPALYTFGTLLTWLGYAFGLRAIYLALKRDWRLAVIAAVVAGVGLFAGSQITKNPWLNVPITWVVMPFAAWATLVSATLVVVRLTQAAGGLNPDEGRAKLKAAGIWALAGAFFVYCYRLDHDAQILFIKGAIPLSAPTAAGLVFLAVATVAVMVLTARAARARGIAKAIVTHLALLAGSVLFGLPLVWLVITSFKEDRDMSAVDGIVWVPKVSQTVPYFDKAKPLYIAHYGDIEVQGHIIERHADGTVKLDINRPMGLRGMTVDTTPDKLKETSTDAPLITATMDGKPITGMVVEELEDGHRRVQALSPPELKGREQVYAPAEVEPIRKVGLKTKNYPEALDFLPAEARKGLVYLQNTLIIVVLGIIGTIFSSAIVAYAFSRMRFPGRNALFTVMLATMMLPGAVTKLPQFMIFKQFGWIDTLYPLWVGSFFGSAFNIFMLRQFFRQIPIELEDAAKIDGAGYLKTFWSVMMPQVKPALAVIAITTFVATWNNFLDPLIYINSPEHMTMSYAVQLYSSDRSTEPGYVTAFTTMSIAPVLALFFFAQRYFIEGVTLSGLGGR